MEEFVFNNIGQIFHGKKKLTVTQIWSGKRVEMPHKNMPLSLSQKCPWRFLPATMSGHKHTDKHATAVHQDLTAQQAPILKRSCFVTFSFKNTRDD